MREVRGRLAPSPTGLLHLGNAWAMLLAWLGARASRGKVVLRMEDLDPARSRPQWAQGIMEDLAWLGLDWDEGPDCGGPHAPYVQSQCGPLYEKALAKLIQGNHAYPCYCTRRELRALASAPHGPQRQRDAVPYSHLEQWVGDTGPVYPGTCRTLSLAERKAKEAAGRQPAWRLQCSGEERCFADLFLGNICLDLERCGGDFALRRSDGVWAYQLAVTVDDARMGINQVVRGEDILVSTPRQLFLFELFNATPPNYAHIPLLHDPQGNRLAKRHQSLSIKALREEGVRPQAIIGWLCSHMGLPAHESPHILAERLFDEEGGFPWQSLPSGPVIVPDHMRDLLVSA